MKEKEIISAGKKVALFMGGTQWVPKWEINEGTNVLHWQIPTGYAPERNKNFHIAAVEGNNLEYHISWDWQIPAWQRFYKTVYDFYNDDAPNEFVQFACDYESEISIGTPYSAFEIFVQALKWFNQQSSKQQ